MCDVAHMMLTRRETKRRLELGGSVRYVQIDASEQGGRDYELMTMMRISRVDLPEVFRIATNMAWFWRARSSDVNVGELNNSDDEVEGALEGAEEAVGLDMLTEERLHEEQLNLDKLGRFIESHKPPPVTLGSGCVNTKDKFLATMHILFLEAPDLRALVSVSK
jgi:hypothetical protein